VEGEEAGAPDGAEQPPGDENAAGSAAPSAEGGEDESSGAQEDKAETDNGDADADDVTQQVTNIFHGHVVVGDGGALGFALDENVRRETGPVPESEIETLRRLYLDTPAYHEALSRLRRLRLLILFGDEDSGRAAASLMLADRVRAPGSRVMRLPPTRSLADLVNQQGLKAGRVFVLHDWLGCNSARSSLARFDAKQLATRLADTDSYLVITASGTARTTHAVPEYEVRWTAPDAASLFDHCFALVDRLDDAERELARLRECAVRLSTPRRVVGLATRLCDGAEAALLSAQDTDQQEVAAWFAKVPPPNRRAVRAAAVLALACRAGDESPTAPGVTQRGFEELFSALGRAEARFHAEKSPDEAPLPNDDSPLPRSRQGLLKDAGLDGFTIAPPRTASVGVEHTPGFRTRRLRDLFLDGLTCHYGEELWSPVREWAADVVARPGIRATHFALSYGVGRMARYATKEVRETYLEQWASGYEAERICAAFALWSMAAADDLAPIALSVATDWVWGRGQERAMAAAIALGGAVGKRYPSEATWWLWRLARRGQRISRLACAAVSNLLVIDAAADDPTVAWYLARQAEAALGPSTALPERRTVLTAALQVLANPSPDANVPQVRQVLRESAAAAEPVGRMWAAVLRSTPHRGGGIKALRQTLASLTGMADGTAVAARLGRHMLPRLSELQRRQVGAGVQRPDPDRDRGIARDVVLAFLDVSAAQTAE